MADLEKEIKKEEKVVKKFFSKKENIWMSVSIVLLVILIVALVMPRGLSKAAAGQAILDFANSRGLEAELVSVNSSGSNLYEVNIIIQGSEIPVYITKDGKFMAQGLIPLDEEIVVDDGTGDTQTPQEVPKTAKPVVEAFVFSYCPYGLQFEKALNPVYSLLKNKADINLVAIGAMHGPHEETESLRQLCIQDNYGKDKLWAYLNKFMGDTDIGTCNSDVSCSKPLVEAIMKSLAIDVNRINTCMTQDAPALYDADGARASSLGISGSPTFVINGVQVNVGRNPEAIKTAICNAFTTAPSECSQTLSTASASSWFGYGDGSEATTAAQC